MTIMYAGVLGGGGGEAIAVGSSKLYVGKQNFVEKGTGLITNSPNGGGYPFRSAVAVSGIAYVSSDNGRVYTTTDFNTFTQVSMNIIPSNQSQNTFSSGAYLFKLSLYPNRIYALSYQLFGGDSNDAIGIWYSDNGCVDWTVFSAYIGGIAPSVTCRGIVESVDGKLYLSISKAGGDTLSLKVIRISDGVEVGSFSDGQGENQLLTQSSIIYRVNNNTYYAGSGAIVFSPAATQVSGFNGYAGASNIIGGNERFCIIGRNNTTGLLQITYNSSLPSGAWTAATLPSIAISGLATGFCRIASLGTNKGFVAVYVDSGTGYPNNSGALYSSDGINWSVATESPAFSAVGNVYANPLAG